MKIKNIIDESFQDYKKPSMLIVTCKCDWKCCIEKNLDKSICQNSNLSQQDILVSNDIIISRYLKNQITKAIVIGGLEPFLQFDDMLQFIKDFRQKSNDDIVIYTGYYIQEIDNEILELRKYNNIIVKFGRYIPNTEKTFDEVLGINLVSDNQYAHKIS